MMIFHLYKLYMVRFQTNWKSKQSQPILRSLRSEWKVTNPMSYGKTIFYWLAIILWGKLINKAASGRKIGTLRIKAAGFIIVIRQTINLNGLNILTFLKTPLPSSGIGPFDLFRLQEKSMSRRINIKYTNRIIDREACQDIWPQIWLLIRLK